MTAEESTSGRTIPVVAAGAVFVAVAMIGFALPRAVASIGMVSGDGVLATLRQGKAVSAPKVKRLISTRRNALAWIDDGQVWADLAFAELELAAGQSKARRPGSQDLQRATLTLRRALSLKPVSPDSWRWLAAARLTAGDPGRAAAALNMSWLTGPNVTYLALPRVRLSILLWNRLDSDQRQSAYRQIRHAWWLSNKRTAEVAALSEDVTPFRSALASAPKELASFESWLKFFKSKKPQSK